MARFLRRLSTNTTRKTIRLRLSKQPAKRIRLLKEGFWEETAIYERPDGQHIVRKASKPTDQPGPWALETLRREILYLVNLPPSATELFPPLLDAWGHKEGNESNDIGYEIPYFQDHVSVSERIASSPPSPQEAAAFQDALGIALFDRLHVPAPAQESISEHVDSTISDSIEKLSRLDAFHPVIERDSIHINDREVPGLRRLWTGVSSKDLDALPCVLLHGDLILENILCSSKDNQWWKDLVLIDPVSVAGISHGPALFDLVKYESYATGELIAIRSEQCEANEAARGSYQFMWKPILPYTDGKWHTYLRQRYESIYGPLNPALYSRLEAYFSLVMAVNTKGTQQWARVLKGTLALAESLHVAT